MHHTVGAYQPKLRPNIVQGALPSQAGTERVRAKRRPVNRRATHVAFIARMSTAFSNAARSGAAFASSADRRAPETSLRSSSRRSHGPGGPAASGRNADGARFRDVRVAQAAALGGLSGSGCRADRGDGSGRPTASPGLGPAPRPGQTSESQSQAFPAPPACSRYVGTSAWRASHTHPGRPGPSPLKDDPFSGECRDAPLFAPFRALAPRSAPAGSRGGGARVAR